jgi:UDP-glucose 4-epimerase
MMVNLAIDNNVFTAAHKANVGTIVHASSACAYPVASQEDHNDKGLLEESMSGFDKPEQSFPDGAYGWVKLMGELQLKNLAESSKVIGKSARIFTAYGERENESHAAVALIAKSLLKMDPFPIWGSGLQTRNFTYVSDTVSGLLHLGADQRDIPYDVFNIGTRTHNTVLEFLDVVFEAVGWHPSVIDKQMDQPMGVGNRASNNDKFQNVFGWEPTVNLTYGVAQTLAWYESWKGRSKSVTELESRLVSR